MVDCIEPVDAIAPGRPTLNDCHHVPVQPRKGIAA